MNSDDTRKNQLTAYARDLVSEMIFPPYLPLKCQPNVQPMVQLLNDLNFYHPSATAVLPTHLTGNHRYDTLCEEDTVIKSSSSQFVHKLQDISTQCLPYRIKVEEYNEKQKVLQQKFHERNQIRGDHPAKENATTPSLSLSTTSDQIRQIDDETEKKEDILSSSSIISPFIKDEVNEKRFYYERDKLITKARIQKINYQYCVAKAACPTRMKQLEHCWESISQQGITIKSITEMGIEESLCQKERESVQRCTGRWIKSYVRDVLE